VIIGGKVTTIQIDDGTREKLFRLMTELQKSFGRRLSFNEVVNHLISEYESKLNARKHLLELFGTLDISQAKEELQKLRKEEEKRLATFA